LGACAAAFAARSAGRTSAVRMRRSGRVRMAEGQHTPAPRR
jgi:hypothetical protein